MINQDYFAIPVRGYQLPPLNKMFSVCVQFCVQEDGASSY